MAAGEENVASLKRQLGKLFEVSLRAVAPDEPNVEPVVVPSAGKFGDYQCNNAMDLWSKIKGKGTAFRGPPSVGQAIMGNLPQSEVIESCSVAGPGFVNIVLSNNWMAKRVTKISESGGVLGMNNGSATEINNGNSSLNSTEIQEEQEIYE